MWGKILWKKDDLTAHTSGKLLYTMYRKMISHGAQHETQLPMFMLDTCFQYSRKRRRHRRPTRRACPQGRKDLLLVHCGHARTFTICRKIVCHYIALWFFTKFHRLQNIIVIMELKWSAVNRIPIRRKGEKMNKKGKQWIKRWFKHLVDYHLLVKWRLLSNYWIYPSTSTKPFFLSCFPSQYETTCLS